MTGRVSDGGGQALARSPAWSSCAGAEARVASGQLAPGVQAPDQGLLTLPMGNFTFTLAAQTNTFQGSGPEAFPR